VDEADKACKDWELTYAGLGILNIWVMETKRLNVIWMRW